MNRVTLPPQIDTNSVPVNGRRDGACAHALEGRRELFPDTAGEGRSQQRLRDYEFHTIVVITSQ
jgi:hypothetical protein